MRGIRTASGVIVCMLLAAAVNAQDVISMDQYYAAIDFDEIEIRIETVSPGLHVLFGRGGNVAASIGDQGVLVVDDQFPAMVPKIRSAIRQLGGREVDFVVNTHWHYDHTFGNPILGEGGSWIVSQANSRQMMTGTRMVNTVNRVVEQPTMPPAGLPVITYDGRMQFHFNGEQVDLLHFGPAHTTGDAAVVFRGHNVVHMGDVYNNSGYPFIDADNGGDIDGLIRFCEAVLDEIDEDAVVIPGHGPVAKYADFKEYVSMLKVIRDRIAALISDGATLEDVIAARPSAEWDAERGDPLRLLDRAYASLAP